MGGLGEAISVKLYDAGYTRVVTYSTNDAGVKSRLARMAVDGRQFRAYAIDVADYDSCRECAQKITDAARMMIAVPQNVLDTKPFRKYRLAG